MRHRDGLKAMVLAGLFSTAMGAAFFKAHIEDPQFSSMSGSFIRVLATFLIIVFPVIGGRGGRNLLLWPHLHKSLWAWGFFGSLTVTTYFFSINAIGSGTTAFLGASSGIFIAALGPIVARQRTSPLMWLALGGALAGIGLMSTVTALQESLIGVISALASGLFGALAYLMIARTRSNYSSPTVMMTWCVSALLAHLLLFCILPVTWPANEMAWVFLSVAGICATLAMHFTTFAFQNAPAARVASLSYISPVFSLIVDCLVFGQNLTGRAEIGAFLIVVFGAALPIFSKG